MCRNESKRRVRYDKDHKISYPAGTREAVEVVMPMNILLGLGH